MNRRADTFLKILFAFERKCNVEEFYIFSLKILFAFERNCNLEEFYIFSKQSVSEIVKTNALFYSFHLLTGSLPKKLARNIGGIQLELVWYQCECVKTLYHRSPNSHAKKIFCGKSRAINRQNDCT